MKVYRIDESLNIYTKSQLRDILSEKALRNDNSLKLLSCIDLLELNELKERLKLEDQRFLLVLVLHSLSSGERSYFAAPLKEGQTFISCRDYWSGAESFEQEISLRYGIKFYLDERVTYDYLDFNKSFYQIDYQDSQADKSYESDLNQTIEQRNEFLLDDYYPLGQRVKFMVHEDDENISKIEVSHSKNIFLDKFLRKKSTKEVIHYLNSISSRYSFVYENLWRETYEVINEVRVDLYQKSLRMLFTELNYGKNSLEILRDSFYVSGEYNYSNIINQLVFKINSSLEDSKMYKGQKFIINYDKTFPLLAQWKSNLTSMLKEVTENLIDIRESISKINRLKEFNFGDQELNLVRLGLTGASLREFGIRYDIRDSDSYYLYRDLERDRPLGVDGSFYDRLLVKIQDSIQSFSDVIRIIESLPFKQDIESNEIKEVIRDQDCIFYSYTESVLGEVSYLSTIKAQTSEIYDMFINTPSQFLLEAFKNVKRPHDYHLVALDWVSMGICHEELSR